MDSWRQGEAVVIHRESPPVFQIQEFLSKERFEEILNTIFANRNQFSPVGVAGNYPNHRRSLGTPNPLGIERELFPAIKRVVPEVLKALDLNFPVIGAEATLTAQHHGDYFARHVDNGLPELASRRVTYVYYISRSPRRFTGGQTTVFPTYYDESGKPRIAEGTSVSIDPIPNSIAFFSTFFLHQVEKIEMESQAFEDGRFGINGWLREATS